MLGWFRIVGGTVIGSGISSHLLAFVIARAAHKLKRKQKTFEVLDNSLFTNISWFFKNLLIDGSASTTDE